MVKMRNKVAHAEPAVSSGFGTGELPDHITLVKYRGGKRVTSKLTRNQAKAEEQAATTLFLQLSKIADAIRQRFMQV